MKQYNRSLDSEMTRVLINESYKEQIETKLHEKRLARLEKSHDKKRRQRELNKITRGNYNKETVDKIERVMTEMREEYNNYRVEELDNYGSDEDIEWEKRISWEMYRSEYGHQDNNKVLNANEYFRWKAFNEEEWEEIDSLYEEEEYYFELNCYRQYLENGNDEPNVYHENKRDFGKEQDSLLKKMLRERHNLPLNKRVLFWDN